MPLREQRGKKEALAFRERCEGPTIDGQRHATLSTGPIQTFNRRNMGT